MQVAVQGAWGIVPVHLNELAPPGARALFPGFAYQLGNLIMSRNAVFQARIAESHGNNYGLALAIFGGAMALLIAFWTAIGPERKNADFTRREAARKTSAVQMRLSGRTDALSSYRGTAEGPDQAKAITAVVAVHLALAFVILTGLNVRSVSQAVERLKTFNLEQPPLPPPPPPQPRPHEAMKKPEGAAGEEGGAVAGGRSAAADPVPSPLPAAKIAGTWQRVDVGCGQRGQRNRRWRFGQRSGRRRVTATPRASRPPSSSATSLAAITARSHRAAFPPAGRWFRCGSRQAASRATAGSSVRAATRVSTARFAR